MFRFMFLYPYQIMCTTNELCVKTDLTRVVYGGNTRAKVEDPVGQLLVFTFDL